MKTVVREANLDSDRELLIRGLLQHLTPHSSGLRFDWLYLNNPHGRARAWLAQDLEDGTLVGLAAAFPKRMIFDGRETLGWVLGDFCINSYYRSLGPALQLQRACFSDVNSGAMDFCYDFPSSHMMAIYKRLGIKPIGQMLRLAKPLRVDRKVREFVKHKRLARCLSTIGNHLLTMRHRNPGAKESLTVQFHESDCGEEFSALDREVSSQCGICIQRSAVYLNWRYLNNPLHRYEMLTARRDNNLVAYAIFTQTDEDATLVDLLGVRESTVIMSLVHSLTELLRQRGVVILSTPLMESHPWIPLLLRLGFSVREGSPVIACTSPNPCLNLDRVKGVHWWLMSGDRDS